MGWTTKLSLATAAATLAAATVSGSAQASTLINYAVNPLGGTPSYTGSSLSTSTAFDFGGGTYQVTGIGAGDQSGLSIGDTVTLTSPVNYGSGNSGSTSLIKSWSDSLGSFTETLTSFIADRSVTNAITLEFEGTLSGPGGLSQPAYAILSANQVGGTGSVGWTFTDSSVAPDVIGTASLPGAFMLFASGLGAIGLFGWGSKRKARAAAG